MEAPNKIYLTTNGEESFVFTKKRTDNGGVEYTRTDAFIEKACEFISQYIESDKYVSPDEESYRVGCPYNYFETNLFIEDLKKYMEE